MLIRGHLSNHFRNQHCSMPLYGLAWQSWRCVSPSDWVRSAHQLHQCRVCDCTNAVDSDACSSTEIQRQRDWTEKSAHQGRMDAIPRLNLDQICKEKPVHVASTYAICSECLSVRPPIKAGPDRTGFVVCPLVCHVRPSVSLTHACVILCVCVYVCVSVRPTGPDRTGSVC